MIVDDYTPCHNKAALFTSKDEIDHRIARPYCVGDTDRPPCHAFDQCALERPDRSSNFDGTWAGVRFLKGVAIDTNPKPKGALA